LLMLKSTFILVVEAEFAPQESLSFHSPRTSRHSLL
jgi:hypothetical protein